MLLNNIKKEFEIIPSMQWYEEYSNGIKIYNDTLAFYLTKKDYNLKDYYFNFIELFYIAVNLVGENQYNEKLFKNVLHIEASEIKKLDIKEIKEQIALYGEVNLLNLIQSKIENYKLLGKKIFFQDRVGWETKEWRKRYYCRRRLALVIFDNNVFRIEPMTDKEEADKRYLEMVSK